MQIFDGCQHPVHRDACTDAQVIARFLDLLQFGAAVEEDHVLQIAQGFRHPQPHIRRPCNQRRVRAGGVGGSELVQRFRGGEAGGLSAPQTPRKVFLNQRSRGRVLEPIGHRLIGGRFCRADDRGIAGAAAEVARQCVVVVPVAVEMRNRHRHDETGRAEAALRSVMVDHRLLHRVQGAVGGADALDRAHRAAVKLGQEEDAGVQRPCAARIGDHHRAGPAIAFVTAFLGASEAALFAQPIEQRCRGGHVSQLHALSVQKKGDIHVKNLPPYQCPVMCAPSMRRRKRAGLSLSCCEARQAGPGLASDFVLKCR